MLLQEAHLHIVDKYKKSALDVFFDEVNPYFNSGVEAKIKNKEWYLPSFKVLIKHGANVHDMGKFKSVYNQKMCKHIIKFICQNDLCDSSFSIELKKDVCFNCYFNKCLKELSLLKTCFFFNSLQQLGQSLQCSDSEKYFALWLCQKFGTTK